MDKKALMQNTREFATRLFGHGSQGIQFLKKHNPPSRFWIFILILLLSGVLIYQQMQIMTLQEQIEDMNYEYGDGLGNKIYHIEYIQDSHTSDIYKTKMKLEKLNDIILGIQMERNDLKWRVMQLEWEQK